MSSKTAPEFCHSVCSECRCDDDKGRHHWIETYEESLGPVDGIGWACKHCGIFIQDLDAEFIPEWPEETLSSRLNQCRAMLRLHGCLTDSENTRIIKRIVAIKRKKG